METNIIETEYWSVNLPMDWKLQEREDRSHPYFESADESKGIYLYYYSLDPFKEADNVLQNVMNSEIKSVSEMEGYSFEILQNLMRRKGEVLMGLFDSFSSIKKYRIVGITMISNGLLLQCDYHDYWCEKIEDSNAFLDLITSSLEKKR